MELELKEEEFDSVRRLPARERYKYFIKKAADSQTVWSLWNNGWALLGDDEGEAVPVWPHAKFAEAFALGEWDGYTARKSPFMTGLTNGFRAWKRTAERSLRKTPVPRT
jgi:hypothetical protein